MYVAYHMAFGLGMLCSQWWYAARRLSPLGQVNKWNAFSPQCINIASFWSIVVWKSVACVERSTQPLQHNAWRLSKFTSFISFSKWLVGCIHICGLCVCNLILFLNEREKSMINKHWTLLSCVLKPAYTCMSSFECIEKCTRELREVKYIGWLDWW